MAREPDSNHATKLPDYLQYARRVFESGSVHYCIQDTRTGDLVKHPAHQYRPFIRHDEVPAGVVVHNWIDCANQGGLFDDDN